MSSGRLAVGIAGASGYAGGELLRLLLGHPGVEVTQATSERHVGRFVHQVHPHLRGQTALRFTARETLAPVDVLFLAMPHGQAQARIADYAALAPRIVDLSAEPTAARISRPTGCRVLCMACRNCTARS